MTVLELTELLYNALNSPHGTCIETDDPHHLRQKLYAVRRSNDDFLPLAFIISPMNGADLWIVKKEPTDEQQA